MKKLYGLLFLFSFLFIASSFADSFTQTYTFEKPVLITGDDGYSDISVKNSYPLADEGNPLLPVFAADVVLPQGHEILSIEIFSMSIADEIEDIRIRPAGKQFPISVGPEPGYKASPNETVYNASGPYPKQAINNINTGFLSGISIGSFSIFPVTYYPTQNKISYIKNITLNIVTGPTPEAQAAMRFIKPLNRLKTRVASIVDNSAMLDNYSFQKSNNDPVDLLLITKTSLIPGFADYIEYKRSVGFIVEIIATEDIYTEYPGQDHQEKIRNCIIDYYENNDLEYVILGGDSDPTNATQNAVPHRGLFALDDNDIPADMYYACLDGNWNDDGDNKWGEPGEYDLYGEIAIGRLCVDNATEIQYFVNKLIKYQDTPVVADIENALMVGEELNNNPLTYGGDCKDEIIFGANGSGFTTVGISANFEIETLYDRDGGWNKYDVFQEFNNVGVNLLNHLGHSSCDYNMKMSSSDVTANNFTNDGITRGFAIGYSQGCYNGSFDNRDWNYYYGQDCFAEKITTIATAEVATIANSRYGWYAPGNTNSSSQFLDRQFFDAIFGEGITRIGYTNASSKEDNASFFGDSYMRWAAYELNLFGDPSMDIWTAMPDDIIVSYPSTIAIGSAQVYVETDVEYARIALVQNNELIGRLVTGASGDGNVEFFNPVSSSEPIVVSVIGHNKNRHIGSMVIDANQPFVLFEAFQINDPAGNGNGIVDFGEEISLGLTLSNVGDQPASDVYVTLSTSCPFVTITDANENFGNFSPGESVFLDNVFTFVVTNNIPDDFPIEFNIMANGEGSWASSFDMNAAAPELELGGISINDAAGNNNNRLDPGESATIVIEALNGGLSSAPSAMVNLLSSNGMLTVISSAVGLETLEPGVMMNASFDVVVSAEAPEGSQANLVAGLSSGFYNIQDEYSLKIGLLSEDWESGNFNQYNWSSSGHEYWTIESSGSYEGMYCARSGDIDDDQFSILKLNSYEVTMDDSIAFFIKVSTEYSDDLLNFYIDSDIVGQWSGNLTWQRVSFPVSAGTHTFKWFYDKDGYSSSGSDCVWVDFIELPAQPMSTVAAGPDGIVCSDESFQCQGSASNYISVQWSTNGTGFFSDQYSLNPSYTPSEDDKLNSQVTLSLTAFTNDGNLEDEMELIIEPLPEINLGPDITTYWYETVTLDAGVEGMLYNWSTGETTKTITVHSGWIIGIVNVSVQVTNPEGCMGYDEITISFEEYTGINEPVNKNMLEVYPNPTNGQIYVSIKNEDIDRIDFSIYNSMNKLVFSETNAEVHQGIIKKIDLKGVPAGIYFLKATTGRQSAVKKIIVNDK